MAEGFVGGASAYNILTQPPQVTALTLTAGNAKIDGSFRAVDAAYAGLAHDYWIVRQAGRIPDHPYDGIGVQLTNPTNASTLSFSLTGLINDMQYGVRVFVRGDFGFQTSPNASGNATPRGGIHLGTLPLMTPIKIAENGIGADFYIVRHNAYSTTRTQMLRKYGHSDRPWSTSNVNAYATCSLDSWFNGAYFNSLSVNIRGQIVAVSIPYTPGNGNNALSNLSRKVFAVSATELGHTHPYLNAEGTALANAANLKIATDSVGNAKVQWTRSPATNSTNSAWSLDTVGGLGGYYCTNIYSARPAFTLPKEFLLNPTPNPDGSYSPLVP